MANRVKLTHKDLGEIEVLSDLHHIYLKPICKVHITVQISGLSSLGAQSKSLSTWEVSEKVRQLCPAQLPPTVSMKVTGVTVDFVRFLVELKSRADLKSVIRAADSQCIKLKGFPQTLRVRTGEAPIDCPRKHDWDSFFRDAKNMNELIPGERPDTIVLSKLPVRWFSSPMSSSNFQPDPKIVEDIFQTFGKVRRIDIPILDPCQNQHLLANMGLTLEDAKEILSDFYAPSTTEDSLVSNQGNNHNGFGKIAPSTVKQLFYEEEFSDSIDSAYPLTFTVYIQFMDYAGFATAMETLRGKKLIYTPALNGEKESAKVYSAEIKVDFDRTKHLSDASVRRRRAARVQLESAAREKAKAAARAAEEAARREAELKAARLAEEERLRVEREAAERRAEEEVRIRAAKKKLRKEKRRRAEEARQAKEAEEKKRILHKRLKREMAKLKAKIAAEEEKERKHHKPRHRHHHHSQHEDESVYHSETNSVKTHSARASGIAIGTTPDKLSPRYPPPSRDEKQSEEDDLPLPTMKIHLPLTVKRISSTHIQGTSPRSGSSSCSSSRDRSPLDSEEERLRRKLIAKREAHLRAAILARLNQ